MPPWISSKDWMNGPLVLSSLSPRQWTAKRTAATVAKLRSVEGEGSVWTRDIAKQRYLVLDQTETSWLPRPWGGYLVRIVRTDSLLDKEYAAAAAWKPGGLTADRFEDVGATLRVTEPLHLVDLEHARDKVGEDALEVTLAPGTYAIEVATEIAIPRNAKVELVRLRNVDADRALVDADAAGDAAPREAVIPIDATARAATKLARFVEPEFGSLLLVRGEDLAAWRGNETDDFDEAPANDGIAKHRGMTMIGFGGPDIGAVVPVGKDLLVIRQLGADKSVDVVAAALFFARSGTWIPTTPEARFEAGAKGVYLIDAAADGAAIAKAKRLPTSAAFAELAKGTYALEKCDLTSATVADGKKQRGVMLEVYRLRRAECSQTGPRAQKGPR